MRTFLNPIIALSLCSIALGACANPPGTKDIISEPQTACTASEAEIAVFDGMMQNLCGCAEPAAKPLSSGTLTCTVSVGTTVFFQYLAVAYQHAIVSTGSPAFTSSPVSDPGQFSNYPVHGVKFDVAGTYTFIDAYNPSVSGEIVVQ